MKKILALVMVLALALAVLSSCAKKEEAKEELKNAAVSYTIYNRTGETVKELTITDTKGSGKMVSSNMADGTSVEVTINAAVDSAGTPDLTVSYETTPGNGRTVVLNQKTDAITLLPDTIDFNAPAE